MGMARFFESRPLEFWVFMVVVGACTVPLLLFLWWTSVPGRSFEGALPKLTQEQAQLAQSLRADVEAIATPRNLNHPRGLEDTARHIESRLRSFGYPVVRQSFQARGQEFRNIEVLIEPESGAASTIVIGAHYDTAGSTPGANDNGSGVAAGLALAQRLAPFRGRSAIRIRFVFFANEEPPFFHTPDMGSHVYAHALAGSGEMVAGMISLETLGYYSDRPGSQHYPQPLAWRYPDRGNFIAFAGGTDSRTFVRRVVRDFRAAASFPSAGGVAPSFVTGIDWSDHWAFERFGIPALMVTDTAPFRYPHYHKLQDTPDKLDYARMARVVSGLEKMLRRWAEPRDD